VIDVAHDEGDVLAGKMILDLTWIPGGPFASQLLAQLSASVR
jgi:crotonobetainyl-CoA:carnitine CoA-transferase CaiB-like acyl-CoA transferase